jgi:excisionase family DNA binding protein
MTIDSLMDGSKFVITRSEAAQLLECDPRTVSRGIEDGTIKAIRLGKRVLVLVKPFLNLLLGSKEETSNGN